jgi:hypothetical protein
MLLMINKYPLVSIFTKLFPQQPPIQTQHLVPLVVGWEEAPALFFERLLLVDGPVEAAVATTEGTQVKK